MGPQLKLNEFLYLEIGLIKQGSHNRFLKGRGPIFFLDRVVGINKLPKPQKELLNIRVRKVSQHPWHPLNNAILKLQLAYLCTVVLKRKVF